MLVRWWWSRTKAMLVVDWKYWRCWRNIELDEGADPAFIRRLPPEEGWSSSQILTYLVTSPQINGGIEYEPG